PACGGFQPGTSLAVDPGTCRCAPEGSERGHDYGRGHVVIGGRWLDVLADFGSTPAPSGVVAEVNHVLSTFSVLPARLPGTFQGWVTHVDLEDGVSMDTPETWGFHTDPVPALIEPPIVFATGTETPIPQGGDCGPDNALKNL